MKLDNLEENFCAENMYLQSIYIHGSGYIKLPLSDSVLFREWCKFKMSQIGVSALHAGHKVAIFTVHTPNQPPKFENLTLNLSEIWFTPKAASCPIGLLMINIKLIPFQHT